MKPSKLLVPLSLLGILSLVSAQERVLPIRGEHLLKELMRPVASIGDISVSPDGSRVFYVETLSTGGDLGRMFSQKPARQYWMLDIGGGQRFELRDFDQDVVARTYRSYRCKAYWSEDSQQLAFLESRNGALSLAVWNTSMVAAPTRTILTQANAELMSTHDLYNWAWLDRQNEVLLGIRDKLQLPKAEAENKQGYENNFTWFRSRLQSPGERIEALRQNPANERVLRLYTVNLRDQSLRQIPTGQDIYTEWGTTADGFNIWSINHQRKLVLMSARDRRARKLDDAFISGAVYVYDVELHSIRKIDSGDPIRGLTSNGSDVVEIRTPKSLSVEPAHGEFGVIYRIGLDGSGAQVPMQQPVPLQAEVYPAEGGHVAIFHEQSYPENRIYELDLSKGSSELVSPKEFSATVCDVSENGNTIAAVLQNVATPPELYVWRHTERKWRKLTDYAANLGDLKLLPTEKVTWRSKDKRFDIDGFVVKPRDFDPHKRYPLIVLIHGGPGGSYVNDNRFWTLFGLGQGGISAQVLANEGYMVLTPNFRGDTGYSVEFSRAWGGNFGREYDYDIDAGIDYLIVKGWVDPEKLGIVGESFGAYQVSYAISHTRRFKAAITGDGSSLLEFLAWMDPYYGYDGAAELYAKQVGFDPGERIWADPYRIRTALLVRWGSDPSNAQLTYDSINLRAFEAMQSAKLYAALSKNHVPIEVVVDHDKHVVVDPKYIVEWHSRVLQWFDYFILNKGENPIPAMNSPIDYREEMQQRTAPK